VVGIVRKWLNSIARKTLSHRGRRFVHLGMQLARDPFRAHYSCPACGYKGPFRDADFHIWFYGSSQTDAECPSCGSFERHRLQRLVFERLSKSIDFSQKSLLHVAPEECNKGYFLRTFGRYVTADLNADDYQASSGLPISHLDVQLDLTKMDLPDASHDVVLATHVLEHIEDDRAALLEIRRILRPGGFAVLLVPVNSVKTIEYGEANGREFGHVRACGPDYFDRYREVFKRVEVYKSSDFPAEHQLYVVQDRTKWPPAGCPMLEPLPGEKHLDYAPVCYV